MRGIYINRVYMAVMVGIIFAILISFSPGGSFILFFAIVAALFINRLSNKSERDFLLGIFLVGFGARIVLTLLTMAWSTFSGHILNYASLGCPNYNTPYIIDDSGYYTLRGLFTSMYWLGKPMSRFAIESIVKNPYGFTGFTYVLGLYFTLFGYSPISSIFISCFLGTLTAILVYSIVKNTFGEKPARVSAVLTAFFPSLFLWSITNLKDTSIIFLACLTLWSIIKLQKTKNICYLIITALSIWLQVFIRISYSKEFFYLTVAILLFYFFCLFIYNLSFKKKIIVLLTIFMIGNFLIFSKRDKIKSAIDNIAQKAYIYHRGVLSEGGICYKLLPDEFYTTHKNLSHSDFLKMLGKGWFHVMLEPFPWRIQTDSMLFSLPQIVLWYLLIPFAILGMGVSLRYRFKESIILSIYFLVMTSALAIAGGNIGTIFRFRDVVTPILLIFSSVGLINTFSSLNLKIAYKKTL